MSVRHAVGCATVLAASVLASGCDSYPPDLNLQVSLSVNPTTFRVSDSTEVVVRLSNHSIHERALRGTACMLGFQIFDSTGAYVGPNRLCAQTAGLHLAPGETIEQRVVWRARTGLDNPEWLLPGSYTMVGVLDAVEAVIQSEAAIQSPEVPIEILPPN